MKIKILFTTILLALLSFEANAQSLDGTYVNEVGQQLIISGHNPDEFDFKVKWGVNDEWGCMFTAEGHATMLFHDVAYSGDDPDWPEFNFEIDGSVITFWANPGYIGMDCARYGDSSSAKYTRFVKP